MEPKRMVSRGVKCGFHNVNLVEGREGNLPVQGSVVKMNTFGRKFTSKTLDMGWRLVTVKHGLIKCNVSCSLDNTGSRINVVGMAEGFLVAEEDAWLGMNINFGVTLVSGQHKTTTSKNA